MAALLSFFTLLIAFTTSHGKPLASGAGLPKWFATRTSYTYTHSNDTRPVEMEGCEPVLLYALVRHGARVPNDYYVEELLAVLPGVRDRVVAAWLEGGGQMTDEEVGELEAWELEVTVEQGGQLVEEGKREHREQGERWRSRLAQLPFSKAETVARSSSKARCKDSAAAYLEGLGLEDVEVQEDDELIRFYDYCPKYVEEVEGEWMVSDAYNEANKLMASEAWTSMLDRVSLKTGTTITRDEIALMWDMCRYERAWHPSTNSPWCPVFTQEDLDLINYREDLVFYYLRGYGYPITAQQTQPLMADMLAAIQSSSNSLVLNAGHSDTLGPFLTALGLYHDPMDLTAEGLGQDHLFDTSRIGSFSTNLDLVVFECPGERRTLMFHQESPIVQPACGEVVCTVDQVVAAYSGIAEADLTDVCSTDH